MNDRIDSFNDGHFNTEFLVQLALQTCLEGFA